VSAITPRRLALLLPIICLAQQQPALRLKNRLSSFEESAARDAEVKTLSPGRRHGIVQFNATPGASEIREIESRGARVLQYVPDHGLLVSAPEAFFAAPRPDARAAALTAPDKLSPLILRRAEGGPARFVVEFHPDVEPVEARALIAREGLAVREHPDLMRAHLVVEGTPADARRLAAWDEVAYVFPAAKPLEDGSPVHGCAGAVTEQGSVGQYTQRIGEGWDGPGKNSVSLTYTLSQLASSLPASSARAEIHKALDEWSRHIEVNFTEGGQPAAPRHLNFLFGRGSHGDQFPFDGPGRVLAHTFYPAPPNPEPIAGDLHFDDDETWRIGADVDLFSVVLHELGHALGLGHSDSPGAVMYPYYRRASTLAAEDILSIQEMYAARSSAAPDPPPSPSPAPSPAKVTITVTSPAALSVTSTQATIAVAGTATGPNLTRVSWFATAGSGLGDGTASWRVAAVPLRAGANMITLTAWDASGLSAAVTLSVNYEPPVSADRTAPVLTITSPVSTNVMTAATGIVLRGTATDDVGVVQVTWASTYASGVAVGTAAWATPAIPLLRGANTIVVRARDAAGNYAWRSLVVTRY
jgi:hypothetical protein